MLTHLNGKGSLRSYSAVASKVERRNEEKFFQNNKKVLKIIVTQQKQRHAPNKKRLSTKTPRGRGRESPYSTSHFCD